MLVLEKFKDYIILRSKKSKKYMAVSETILDLIHLNPDEFNETAKNFFPLKYFLPYIYVFSKYISPRYSKVFLKKGGVFETEGGERIVITEAATYQWDFVREEVYKTKYSSP